MFGCTTVICVVYTDLKKLIWQKIELTRDYFRLINFYNFRCGLWRLECIYELKSLFGDKASSYSTVENWFSEFNYGRRSLKDEVREGPPKTAVVSENIDAVLTTVVKRRGPWRSSKNSRTAKEHWCRAWTDKARSSCDIPWDRGTLGHLFHQHTFNIAWTPGRKKDLFSLDPAQFDKPIEDQLNSIRTQEIIDP